MASRRWLPLSGLAFVVLVLLDVIAIGGSTPSTSASAAKLASFYDTHEARQVVTSFVLAATAPFLALFGVYLASALAGRGAESPIWTRLLTVGTAIAATMPLLAAFVHFALTDSANHLSGEGIRALAFLDGDGWVAWNAGLGVLMLAAAGALLSAPVPLPRWLGWIAAVAGVALFIPFADFFALLVTLLWIAVVSVILWRSAEAAPAAALDMA